MAKAPIKEQEQFKSCENCIFAVPSGTEKYSICQVTLPPYLRKSENPRDYMVSNIGLCALHKFKRKEPQ